ncbi:MAG: FG-GAP repeat domain-containing protein [Acidobacteriota bacterium]
MKAATLLGVGAPVLIAGLGLLLPDNRDFSPVWVGRAGHRILVRVDPIDSGARQRDQMPARLVLGRELVAQAAGEAGRRLDVASLQIARYREGEAQPADFSKWAYGQAPWEVPFRWYDDSIPWDFPEFAGNIDRTEGRLEYGQRPGWGYFYETLGEWESGRLAWVHTQERNKPSYYAIYFDLLPAGQEPGAVPRRGFLGDGFERITDAGASTHGVRTGRVETTDWNGDGLTDILLGGERGGMIWFPNRGSRSAPSFPYSKMLFMADGRPLDVGFSSAPLVVDWDGDGRRDLLSGAEWNRALFYRNVGTNSNPRLEYRGFLQADGKPLALPHEPNPEIKGIYKTDYHPVLAAGDWDGDGDEDLLAGGYVTGMVFWFENIGRDAGGVPLLRFRGPVEADNAPIDTEWCAAPCLADFDADHDLDLISGSMAMTAEGGDSASSENFLYYFENVGTAGKPALKRRPFPVRGRFHQGHLASPRAADLNGDGLLDLVVGSGADLYLFFNVGARQAPLWQYDPKRLSGHWTTDPIWGQVVDWNQDGQFDLVQGFSVWLNRGVGNPGLFEAPRSLLPPGEEVFHKSPRGDQWTFTQVADLDSDGRADILYGVHEGWVYFHRNRGGTNRPRYDTAGVKLRTTGGLPLQVGPQPGQKWDFDVLQGARTTLTAADYDRDGRLDLVVGDTYGKVRYYRQVSGGPAPTFAAPVLIAEVGSRLVPATTDWDGDGWPDVLIGAGKVHLVLNAAGRVESPFWPARVLEVPPVPFNSTITGADWNGDGDNDLLDLASYGYLCWYERSFLEHGYRTPGWQKLEKRR